MSALRRITVMTLIACFSLGYSSQAHAQEWLPKKTEETITITNLAKELIRQDVDHWKVVLAQAIVESGWDFDSYLFQKTNNFIGMRIPYARKSTRVGEFKQYSVYASWKDCVKDVKMWQEKSWDGGNEQAYIQLMQNIWAESPQYYNAVSFVTNRINRMIADYEQDHTFHFNYRILQAYLKNGENKVLSDL